MRLESHYEGYANLTQRFSSIVGHAEWAKRRLRRSRTNATRQATGDRNQNAVKGQRPYDEKHAVLKSSIVIHTHQRAA